MHQKAKKILLGAQIFKRDNDAETTYVDSLPTHGYNSLSFVWADSGNKLRKS